METLFIVVSFIFFACAGYFKFGTDWSKHDKLSTAILTTAGLIYCLLGFLYHDNPEANLRPWRYIDWIITVPLLIYQMYLFLNIKAQKWGNLASAVICSMIMLALGWLGEIGVAHRGMLGVLSTFFGAYTFIVLGNGMEDKDSQFYTFVAVVWLFYPIVYAVDQGNVLFGYAVADLLAKVGTAFYIKSKEDAI